MSDDTLKNTRVRKPGVQIPTECFNLQTKLKFTLKIYKKFVRIIITANPAHNKSCSKTLFGIPEQPKNR